MEREKGIARCGLACCLCARECPGCQADGCAGAAWCENRRCSMEKGLEGCYGCEENCGKGLLQKIKPRAFRLFVQRYGIGELMDCLERNEKNGVVYHREGITGDSTISRTRNSSFAFFGKEKRKGRALFKKSFSREQGLLCVCASGVARRFWGGSPEKRAL